MRIYSIPGLFVAVVLVLAGFACAFLIKSKVTFTCARGSNAGDTCVLTSDNRFHTSSREIKLNDITGATVVSHTTFMGRLRRGRSSQYRIELQTRNGRIPLTEGATRWSEELLRKAQQITTFVKGRSRATLKIEDTDDGLGSMVGMVMVVAGIVLGKFSVDRKSEDYY